MQAAPLSASSSATLATQDDQPSRRSSRPSKRKSVFEDDETLDSSRDVASVVSENKPPSRILRSRDVPLIFSGGRSKRQRVSYVASTDTKGSEIVLSSQSDEYDLSQVLPAQGPPDVTQSVQSWLSSSQPRGDPDALSTRSSVALDMGPGAEPENFNDAAEAADPQFSSSPTRASDSPVMVKGVDTSLSSAMEVSADILSPVSANGQVVNPTTPHDDPQPSSSSRSRAGRASAGSSRKPSTPLLTMDSNEKTNQLIDQIMRETRRAVTPVSDDDSDKSMKALKPLDDESDLEDFDLQAELSPVARKAPNIASMSPLTSPPTSPRHKSSRSRSPSPSARASRNLRSRTKGRASNTSTKASLPGSSDDELAMSPPSRSKPKPKPKSDRSKKLLSGLAKEMKQRQLREDARMPLSDDDMDDNEAGPSPRKGLERSFSSSSQESLGGERKPVPISDEMRKEFGKKGVVAMEKMLADSKGKGKAVQAVGVQFWDERAVEDAMSVDSRTIPALKVDETVCVFKALGKHVRNGDAARLSIVLGSGMLRPDDALKCLPWLFELSTSPSLGAVSERAYAILISTLRARSAVPDKLDLGTVLVALVRFGARKDVLGYVIPGVELPELAGQVEDREVGLKYFAGAVELLANVLAFDRLDVPKTIALMLAIAMDPSTPADVVRSVIASVDSLCAKYCPPEGSERSPAERAICKKLLALSEAYSRDNKAHMLSFLVGGAHVVRRIAQWLAFDMLFPKSGLATTYTGLLPPIATFLTLFVTKPQDEAAPTEDSATSSSPFEIKRQAGEADMTDYDTMRPYVEILSKALTNMNLYIPDELAEAQRAAEAALAAGDAEGASPSKRASPPEPNAVLLFNELRDMEGKIVDKQSDSPMKSLVKDMIQHLHIRLQYEWEMETEEYKTRKTENLFKPFKKQPPKPRAAHKNVKR